MAVAFALLNAFAVSVSGAQIEEFFELVRDAEQVRWEDSETDEIIFDARFATASRVFVGERKELSSEELQLNRYADPSRVIPTLEIERDMTPGSAAKEVRGIWENRLPFARKIQAELLYDVFCDASGQEAPVEISLSVEIKDAMSASGWRLDDSYVLHNARESKPDMTVREIGGERFKTYGKILDLTDYAGDYVRVGFKTAFASSTSPQTARVRWIEGRLVFADFEITVGSWDNTRKPGQPEKAFDLADTEITGASELVEVADLQHYPDAGMTIEYFGGHDVAYICSNLETATSRSTYLFDMGQTRWKNASVANIKNNLVRDNGLTVAPMPTGTPFPVLEPMPTPAYELDNDYTGIMGVIESPTIGMHEYLHAYFGAEDKFYGGTTAPYGQKYARIGYARSVEYDGGYSFDRLNSSGQNTSVVLTAAFTEQEAYDEYESLRADFTQTPTPFPARKVYGVGGASIIRATGTNEQGQPEEYYYLIFSNAHAWGAGLDDYPWDGNAFQRALRGHLDSDGIGVARCPSSAIDVAEGTYESTANQWKKYFDDSADLDFLDGNGDFDESGLGGQATRVVPERWHPKVSWNEELSKWLLTAADLNAVYLYVASQLHGPWSDGWKLLNKDGTGVFGYAAMTEESEKYTNRYNYLYYASSVDNTAYGHRLYRVPVEIVK